MKSYAITVNGKSRLVEAADPDNPNLARLQGGAR